MAACLLILQYVSFQLSYDQFDKNAATCTGYITTLPEWQIDPTGTITYSAIGKAMQDDFPEVINHARVNPSGKKLLSIG